MAADPGVSLNAVLRALGSGQPVSAGEMQAVLARAESASLSASEAGFFLGALAARARTDDAVSFVAACRAISPPRRLGSARGTVNVVGTGGGRGTFNVSTAAAFVLAALGVPVAKTGSRSYSGRSGFVEVATQLGVLADLGWAELGGLLDEVGIVLVPPQHYPAPLAALGRLVAPASWRVLGGFVNGMGPALSPVAVDVRVWGASTPALEDALAAVARDAGDLPTWIVRGAEGLDEASTLGATHLRRVAGGADEPVVLDVHELGLTVTDWPELAAAGTPRDGARLVSRILEGGGTPAQNELVALNAAVVLLAAGRETDLAHAHATALAALAAGAGAKKMIELRVAASAATAATRPDR